MGLDTAYFLGCGLIFLFLGIIWAGNTLANVSIKFCLICMTMISAFMFLQSVAIISLK